MTGPISPPPEDEFGDDFEQEDDRDAGEPDEEIDEGADGDLEE
jgi:hypothetical protein